jgi:hypothetical protein
MGKGLCFIFLSTACLGMATVNAQNWVNGGNILSANGTLGTNSSHSLLFETSGLERGRITNGGNWGIGTASPLSKFAVNSAASTSPFRAQIAGVNKFIVNSNGGVTIGSSTAGPANGLYVAGNVGIGTTAPSYKFHVVGGGYFSNGLTVDNGIFSKTFSASGTGLTSWGGSSGVMARGTTYGVHGTGTGTTSYGVYGTGNSYGVYGIGGSYGVFGKGVTYGLYGTGTGTSSIGVLGTGNSYGIYGTAPTFNSNTYGVYGSGYYGVYGSGLNGVYGISNTTTGNGVTARATGSSGWGVYAHSQNSYGIFAATGYGSYAGYFSGSIYVNGTYGGSDRKLKQNITDIGSAIEVINKLQPKEYEYRQDGNFKLMNLPKGKHYGLIAQDLEQVLPDLVKETEFHTGKAGPTEAAPPLVGQSNTGGSVPAPEVVNETNGEIINFKAVNYTELIPLMVKAMQEQQQVINNQQQLIEQQQQHMNKLQNELTDLKLLVLKLTGQNINTPLSSTHLSEAMPNPVKGSATIQYAIPEGNTRAQLLITDALGRQIKTIQLSTAGVINVDATSLASGVYNYSLIVDNKTVVTRKMTVVK